jgi:hypothetical protein
VELVAQVHDSCIFDTPRREVGALKEILQTLWAGEIPLKGGALVLPIDLKDGERMSDF